MICDMDTYIIPDHIVTREKAYLILCEAQLQFFHENAIFKHGLKGELV